MKVEILTPEKIVFEGEVEVLTLPTRSGHISIMSNHASLVSAVEAGEIRMKTAEGERVFQCDSGVIETMNNKTHLLLRKCVEK